MADTLALDFGTSRTKVAYWNPGPRRPELMHFHDNAPYLPSLFYLVRGSEQILWGFDAEEMLGDDPAGIVDVLKRRLQERYIYANRRKVSPTALLALLLRELRAQAGAEVAAFQGRLPQGVCLTLPALAGPAVEKLMREAAGQAGFETVDLVPEPVAAARAWLMESGETGRAVVVLDCGGGTIDWAYLRYEDSSFRLVPDCPPGGDLKVGGHDVDCELVNHLKELVPDASGTIESRQSYYLREVRRLKERYCRELPYHPIRVGAERVELPGSDIQAVLDARFIQQACDGLKAYLDKLRSHTDSLPVVLLVGGSARTKGLKQAIETQCGCKTTWWDRSEYATVLGAVQGPHQVADQPSAPAPTPSDEAGGRYRAAVEAAWSKRQVGTAEVQHLIALARELGLAREQAAGIERDIMGDSKEAILDRQRSREFVQRARGAEPEAHTASPEGPGQANRQVAASAQQVSGESSESRPAPSLPPLPEKAVRTLSTPGVFVECIAVRDDSRWLASGGADGNIRLWDVDTGYPLRTLAGHAGGVLSLAFSPNGRWLASASDDRSVRLWAPGERTEARVLREHSDQVWSVVFSPNGRYLASASWDRSIMLYDPEGAKMVRTFWGNNNWVRCLAFSPDGNWLASGGDDRSVRLWELASGALRCSLVGHRGTVNTIAFSPCGRWLASGSADHTVRLWDVDKARELQVLVGHEQVVASVAFPPSGRFLASAGWDGTIRLWEMTSGRMLKVLAGHGNRVCSLAFTPDGLWLASGSHDQTIRLWA